MLQFKKLNKKPLKLYYAMEKGAYFNYKNKRYYINDFIRIHQNTWFNDSNYPGFIHGMQQNEYYKPLFIELLDGYDTFINVYQEEENNDNSL